jgi:phospholipid/cholesterol/gamma-HCH transport system ATP-binding protein
MEIGENIIFINEGKLWWNGNKQNILTTDNQELKDFIFCSALTKKLQEK